MRQPRVRGACDGYCEPDCSGAKPDSGSREKENGPRHQPSADSAVRRVRSAAWNGLRGSGPRRALPRPGI